MKDKRRDPLSVAAVDHEGEVLEAYVKTEAPQSQGSTEILLRKAMSATANRSSSSLTGLRSYNRQPVWRFGNAARQETGRWLN